jgi:hypothetical protein
MLAMWAPASERTQMISIMRGLAQKLATGVQASSMLSRCCSGNILPDMQHYRMSRTALQTIGR